MAAGTSAERAYERGPDLQALQQKARFLNEQIFLALQLPTPAVEQSKKAFSCGKRSSENV